MSDPRLDQSIKEVIKGNANAFAYVVEKYQALAFNIALPIVKDRVEAEEVVQDAFVKIYRFIGQYNGVSRFSSWLYKIVYHTALTRTNSNAKAFLKQEELKHELENDDENDHISDLALDIEIRNQWIDEAMDQLSESDRLIVTLFYFGEKTIPEIAEITSWQTSKCKVKLMRARHKLAALLKHKKKDLL